jgi:phthiocerol/phenolphthiocerol synthesis type-I polyketide synthase E
MTPEEVAGLMGEALDDEDVGLDENFFEIGGNSFMLLRVIARVGELTSVRLRVLDVVRAASPNELAALISARAHDDSGHTDAAEQIGR